MPVPSLQDLRVRLAAVGQQHLLAFHDQLPLAQQQSLLSQIADLDLASLPALINDYIKRKPHFHLSEDVAPAPYYSHIHNSRIRPWDRAKIIKAGEDLIRRGKVAAFVVAGGQGSRLGYEGPKGCFPAGAVTGKSLFAFFADNLLGVRDRYGVRIPWYIMTSPLNHGATLAFFEQQKFFGLDKSDIMFFPQGTLPSLDITTGQILLASKHELATNPDGHGGAIKALKISGAIADMRRRGIEHISYFQVDNPIVRILDPIFLGLHVAAPDSSAEMSSKMVPKAYAEEKLGLFCQTGSSSGKPRVEVIEYSDLPMDRQRETLPDGTLRFIAGSIAIHILGVEFVERLASDPKFSLPYHRAEKKIPCIDLKTGSPINPTANNCVKLERFVFDALPMCKSSIVYETSRLEEFAPIKNATGVDSVESSKHLQTERAAKWLEFRGVQIPKVADGANKGKPDCTIELSPRTATSAQELEGESLPRLVERGARLSL